MHARACRSNHYLSDLRCANLCVRRVGARLFVRSACHHNSARSDTRARAQAEGSDLPPTWPQRRLSSALLAHAQPRLHNVDLWRKLFAMCSTHGCPTHNRLWCRGASCSTFLFFNAAQITLLDMSACFGFTRARRPSFCFHCDT